MNFYQQKAINRLNQMAITKLIPGNIKEIYIEAYVDGAKEAIQCTAQTILNITKELKLEPSQKDLLLSLAKLIHDQLFEDDPKAKTEQQVDANK